MKTTNTLVAAVGLLFAGCAGESTVPPMTTTVRDSAAITIVENSIDTARARAGWAIDSVPTLIIGGLDAPEDQQLFQVRGGRRLPDGRIVVMDGGSGELRIYDATRELVRKHGRKGEGPGEFMEARLVGGVGGDTLIVYDSRLRRVSHLHADDGFIRSYQIGAEGGGYPVAIGITSDGGLAVGGGMRFSSDEGFPSGAVRPNSRYVTLAPDGSVRGDWGEVPAREMFARVGPGSFNVSSLPFGRATVAAAAPDRLWLGTGDAWEINVYTLDAALTRIVRFDRTQERVTDELRAAALEEQLEDAADDAAEQSIRSQFRDMPSPDLVPPYQVMTIDALDHVWIGEYVLPGETVRNYTIVDAEGRAAGRITLPPRTSPLDIGADYLLGLTRDDLDVEQLTLWRLTRP